MAGFRNMEALKRKIYSSRTLRDQLNDLGRSISSGAATISPVRTGALKANWYSSVQMKVNPKTGIPGFALILGDRMSYAAYVELGTINNRAQGMLHKTLKLHGINGSFTYKDLGRREVESTISNTKKRRRR